MESLAFLACVVFVATSVNAGPVQDATLKAHNDARRAEAKQFNATNLYELVWNADLAHTARAWANKCDFSHQNTHEFGENLYYRTPRTHDDAYYINLAVTKWMAEKADDTNHDFGCCSSGHHSCCHYTQVVSARTMNVACAVGHCAHLTRNGNNIASNAAFIVCDYKPSGNVFVHGSHDAYSKGTLCGACASGDTCSDGLCVNSN